MFATRCSTDKLAINKQDSNKSIRIKHLELSCAEELWKCLPVPPPRYSLPLHVSSLPPARVSLPSRHGKQSAPLQLASALGVEPHLVHGVAVLGAMVYVPFNNLASTSGRAHARQDDKSVSCTHSKIAHAERPEAPFVSRTRRTRRGGLGALGSGLPFKVCDLYKLGGRGRRGRGRERGRDEYQGEDLHLAEQQKKLSWTVAAQGGMDKDNRGEREITARDYHG
eukprot:603350-Hanusia_phi.AAC.2